jgi:uncharacterized protein YndB with AHSA1/START domain
MYDILHDIEIKSEASYIFNCITTPKHLNNWWTKNSEGIAELDHVYRFYFTPEYDWNAKITKLDRNSVLEFTMTKADDDWAPTRFGFRLNATGSGTMLSFYHKNWQTQNHHFRKTSCCWALLLKGLKDYCENGIIVPFENRA